MAVIEQRLQGLTDAEFGRAEWYFRRGSDLQVAITVLAAASVFITNEPLSLGVAIVALALVGLWAASDWRYKDSRYQAERGRKALWIADGLGDKLTKSERREVEAAFHVSDDEGRSAENPDYFASKAPPGEQRLTELIEESGFYSCRLFNLSASWAWTRFVMAVAVAAALLLSSILVATYEQLVTVGRLVCTGVIFFIGNEMLGAARGYTRAHEALSSLQARVRAIRGNGYPAGDLLLLLGDYNSAVESAPMMAPRVYEKHRVRLDDLWRRHLEGEA